MQQGKVSVLDDLNYLRIQDDRLYLDDIVDIKAVLFRGVYDTEDMFYTLKYMEDIDPEFEKVDVRLQDLTPVGTHAYEVEFLGGRSIFFPIFQRYIPQYRLSELPEDPEDYKDYLG